jgi:hypothetical protein
MKFLNILLIAGALSFASCAHKKACKGTCTDKKQCELKKKDCKKSKKHCADKKQCKLKKKKAHDKMHESGKAHKH